MLRPPVPATNSATTAPISARPLETRSPAKKNGSALGNAQIDQLLQPRGAVDGEQVLMALVDAAQADHVVFEMIGKIAMMVAQMTSARCVFLTKMMISGAIATIGVTCMMIA